MRRNLPRESPQCAILVRPVRYNRRLHVAIVGCLLGAIVGRLLPFGIAQAQPVTMEPRQPTASQSYLDLNAWCADYRPGITSADSRAAGVDLKRLQTVQATLAPGFDPGRRGDGISLLRGYRQALEQRHPDAELAATYLALTSTVPITFAMVERINALLCISSTRAFAQTVADEAEAERHQMAR